MSPLSGRQSTSTIVLVVLVAAAAMAVWIARANGFSARTQPTAVERVVMQGVHWLSVPRAARAAANPVTFSPEVWAQSRAHFADHCASCHANDGSGHTELGRGLFPRAPDMRAAGTQDKSDGELYWIIENGIRLTGMPAWGTGGGNDLDTWKLVHFIRRLKELTPEQLKEMAALNPKSPAELEEEKADERFLAGEDVAPSAAPHHH
jgi:mono/diheme cytochrome c family protein